MSVKELKRRSRVELLEILVEQSREIERLEAELRNARAELDKKQILIDNAGSIAEAALQLNEVFAAAQKAADQYLSNVKRMSKEKDS